MPDPSVHPMLYKEPVALVAPNGDDLCVICKDDTGVPSAIPIDLRENYLEGVGQLCAYCARRNRTESGQKLGFSPPEEIL